MILHGGKQPIEFTYKDGVRAYSVNKPFEGVLHNLQRRWQETDSAWVREEMSRYQAEKPCRGLQRRPPEARGVGRAGGRRAHRGGVRPVDPPGAGVVRRGGGHAHAATRRDRRAHFEGDRGATEASSMTWGWST